MLSSTVIWLSYSSPACFPSRCRDGFEMTPNGKTCEDANDCLSFPCLNGATCHNQPHGKPFTCECPQGYSSKLCGTLQSEHRLKLGMGALAIILACLIILLRKYRPFNILLSLSSVARRAGVPTEWRSPSTTCALT